LKLHDLEQNMDNQVILCPARGNFLFGRVFGDTKPKAEGDTDKAAGEFQNAVGGMKYSVRGK